MIDATEKSWGGQVAFSTVPTLAGASNLADMPKLDLLVVDEAHHAVAASYRHIIDPVRRANPDAGIFLVTATPMGWPTGWAGFGPAATARPLWLRRMRSELSRLNCWRIAKQERNPDPVLAEPRPVSRRRRLG